MILSYLLHANILFNKIMKENFIQNILRSKIFFLPFISFIFIINKVLCGNTLLKSLELSFPHSFTLFNKNIFIIHQNGIIVYDPTLTTLLYEFNFPEETKITNTIDDIATIYLQVPVEEKPIFLFIKKKWFFAFSSNGTYILHDSISNYMDNFPEDLYFSFNYYYHE